VVGEGAPQRKLRVRKIETVAFQYGYGSYVPGKGSRFVVLVHLGRHETPEAALSAWPDEIRQLRSKGRHERADALEAKLRRLRELVNESDEEAKKT
jgi:hypothetical protein